MQLLLDGSDVCIYGFIEQVGLGLIELLAAPAELPAFEDHHLVRELVYLGLPVEDLAVFAFSLTWAINCVTISRSSCAFRFVSESGARTMPCSVPVIALCANPCMPG